MSEKTLSGKELEAFLSQPAELALGTLTGMAKPSASAGSISFAPGGCENWVDIPVSLIKKAEVLGQQPCRDHTHPLVRLTLKAPNEPVAKILLALVGSLATASHAGGSLPYNCYTRCADGRWVQCPRRCWGTFCICDCTQACRFGFTYDGSVIF